MHGFDDTAGDAGERISVAADGDSSLASDDLDFIRQ